MIRGRRKRRDRVDEMLQDLVEGDDVEATESVRIGEGSLDRGDADQGARKTQSPAPTSRTRGLADRR
jgi:hypothetical protein